MEQYELIIKTDQLGSSDGGDSNVAGETEEQTSKLATTSAFAKKAVTYVATSIIRPLVVARVGEVTRDSLLQRKVDVGLAGAQHVAAAMVHPALGIASVGISLISQTVEYTFKMNQEGRRLEIMNERAGNVNRSR